MWLNMLHHGRMLKHLVESKKWKEYGAYDFFYMKVFVVDKSLSHVWLSVPMDCSMSGFPVLHLSPGVCSNSWTLSLWCHPTISSSVTLLLLPLIFPSIRIFSNEPIFWIKWQKYWSFSFSISSSMNTQDWFPWGFTGLISWQSKGFSRVFSNTTV